MDSDDSSDTSSSPKAVSDETAEKDKGGVLLIDSFPHVLPARGGLWEGVQADNSS